MQQGQVPAGSNSLEDNHRPPALQQIYSLQRFSSQLNTPGPLSPADDQERS